MAGDQYTLEIPLTEKLKGIPGIFGIRLGEKPLYEVVDSNSSIEIRKYHPFIMATVTVNGSFEEARKEAFFCLAHYIFGQNKDKKQLKMTSPVLQEASGGWTMSFILPMQYTLATAPTPKDKRIHLHKNPERLVATLRYSGINDQEKIKKHSAELMQWLSTNDTYSPVGEIQSAQYDGPATIPFLRKNEIHIEVTQTH